MWRLRLLVILLGVAGCTASPPNQPENLCGIFEEKSRWYKHAKRAERRWGIPVPVAMAFVHRESSFVAKAKPPRKRLLGIVPWRRLSSAYGYAQATDEAWQDYLQDTRRRFADRDDFDDAIDFIGWYNHRSHKTLGIAKNDAFHLYLAYYTGPGGYRKGVWRGSATINGYARKVADQAQRYSQQLQSCEKRFKRRRWFAQSDWQTPSSQPVFAG